MNATLAFARECGPTVELLLDSWHWRRAGATTEDIIAAGRDRIVHVSPRVSRVPEGISYVRIKHASPGWSSCCFIASLLA